jgi:hypothetical protein
MDGAPSATAHSTYRAESILYYLDRLSLTLGIFTQLGVFTHVFPMQCNLEQTLGFGSDYKQKAQRR